MKAYLVIVEDCEGLAIIHGVPERLVTKGKVREFLEQNQFLDPAAKKPSPYWVIPEQVGRGVLTHYGFINKNGKDSVFLQY